MHSCANTIRTLIRLVQLMNKLKSARILDESHDISARDLQKLAAMIQVQLFN